MWTLIIQPEQRPQEVRGSDTKFKWCVNDHEISSSYRDSEASSRTSPCFERALKKVYMTSSGRQVKRGASTHPSSADWECLWGVCGVSDIRKLPGHGNLASSAPEEK